MEINLQFFFILFIFIIVIIQTFIIFNIYRKHNKLKKIFFLKYDKTKINIQNLKKENVNHENSLNTIQNDLEYLHDEDVKYNKKLDEITTQIEGILLKIDSLENRIFA